MSGGKKHEPPCGPAAWGFRKTELSRRPVAANSLRRIGTGFALAAAFIDAAPARAEGSPPDPSAFAASLAAPSETRLTFGRVDKATTVTVDAGAEAARVTLAGAVAGAQVIASRSADIVGRPIDIFRPLGTRSGGPTVFPSGMPVAARVSSGFGWRTHPTLGGRRAHSGVDLAAAYGSPVIATADGIVGEANWRGGYGLFVAVESGDVQTRYAHMSRLNVAAGQRVRKGDVIGYVGSTGRSTGPHLHYEVRVNGQAVDPLRAKVK